MADDIASYDKEAMTETVSYFKEHAKTRSNGIIEVPKPAFMEQIKRHGVTQGDFERVQTAVDFVTTAAGHVALEHLEEKVGAAGDDDLKDETFRKSLSSTVRLPTHGGATEVTVKAETKNPIPFRGEEGGEPQFKTSYGVTRTTINSKGRMFRDFHEEANNRMRKALRMEETVD